MNGCIWYVFHHFHKGNYFCDGLFASLDDVTFPKIRSILEEKNLLLWEQILSLKTRPPLERETKM